MPEGYEIEVGRTDKPGWEDIIQTFDDGSIYQTWSWGAVRRGEKSLSHVVLKKDGRIVAAAQVWITIVPFLNRGIAYVKRGPMWQARAGGAGIDHFRYMVRALREEYAEKRGLLMRIMPNAVGESVKDLYKIMLEEGFAPNQNCQSYRTFLIDLSQPLDKLRMGLKRKWRQNLYKAERSGLTVEEGDSAQLFDTALKLYREMHARKKFAEYLDVEDVRRVHESLPGTVKMKVMVCRHEGKPVTAYITSQVGGMGVDVVSGTVSDGLWMNSSYLVHWRMLELLKSSGCRWYDLGGIEPVNFPGPYNFKSGIAGRFGKDVVFSQFDFSRGKCSKVMVGTADRLKHAGRTVKELAARLRQPSTPNYRGA